MTTTDRIVTHLRETWPSWCGDVEADTPLVSSARLTSMDSTLLEVWMEREFGVSFGACELSVNTADTAQQIAALVEKKQRG